MGGTAWRSAATALAAIYLSAMATPGAAQGTNVAQPSGPGGVLGGGAPALPEPEFAPDDQQDPFNLPPADTLQTPRRRPLATGLGFKIDEVVITGAGLPDLAAEARRLADDAIERVRTRGDGLWRPTDVLALRDEITRAYIAAGYVNSGAMVEQQDVGDGVLDIKVIEGKLTDIPIRIVTPTPFGGFVTRREFEAQQRRDPDAPPPPLFADEREARLLEDLADGEDLHRDDGWRPFQLRKDVIRRQLNPDPDASLNVNDLQDRFQLLVSDPSIRKIDAALEPGAEPGQGRLRLNVDEAQPFSLEIGGASDRSPSIGGERGFIAFSARNALGRGDVFSAQFGATEGLIEASGGYDVPILINGPTLHLFGSYSDSEIIEEPLSDLDILSESLTLGGGVSTPLARGIWRGSDDDSGAASRYEVTLRGDVSYKRAQTELLGQGFDLSPGASPDGVTELTVATASADAIVQSTSRVVAGRLAANFGLSANDPANAATSPPENFFYLLGQAQVAQRVFPSLGHQVIARLDAQYSPEALFSTERFSFGGIDSVRGYRKNQVTADNVLVTSIEYRASLAPIGREFGTRFFDGWSLGAFAEAGWAANAEVEDPIDDHLASTGLQLNFSMFDRFEGQFYYGLRLEEVVNPEDDMFQDTGFGFRVTLRGL